MCAPFSPRKYKSILRGFNEKDSLPGDSHVALLLRMTNINPQCAKGTHRAARCIAFANRQKHRIIAFAARQNSVPTLSFIKLLDIAGFFGYTRFAS